MQTRAGKIIASGAGGTAGKGSKTYKLTIPSSWISKLGLAGSKREVVLSFDGETIIVRPVQSMDQYLEARLAEGHHMLNIRYYDRDILCSIICADRTVKDLRVENHTDNLVKTAFGKKQYPDWNDLEQFLEERCISRHRAGLKDYLDALGVDEYEPLEIIRKTEGRMAEDDQWMEMEEIP